jgi:hypothetical protein
MQIMSLTEERVIEMEKLMRDKKEEHDRLEKMHIYELWQGDLDKFLIELDKYEEQEERDRLAHTSQANGGKAKGGKKGAGAKRAAGAAPAKKNANGNGPKKPEGKEDTGKKNGVPATADGKKQMTMKEVVKKKGRKGSDEDEDYEDDS